MTWDLNSSNPFDDLETAASTIINDRGMKFEPVDYREILYRFTQNLYLQGYNAKQVVAINLYLQGYNAKQVVAIAKQLLK